jgi:hypothetical protein
MTFDPVTGAQKISQQVLPPKYYFKVFSRVDCNIEKTLLKISFKDLDVLKSIVDHLNTMLKQEYL